MDNKLEETHRKLKVFRPYVANLKNQYEVKIKELTDENRLLKSADPLNKIIKEHKEIIKEQKIQIVNLKQRVHELETEADTDSYGTVYSDTESEQ